MRGFNEIPLIEVDQQDELGPATLIAQRDRAEALISAATRGVSKTFLSGLDKVSRRWMARWNHENLPEIDRVARILGRPGVYFLSANYEWGCTCRVAADPTGSSARLVRVLDWGMPGLGEYVIAARVAADAGPYLALTWPGYTGVLQGMAPGRFSAALNQAPMRRPIGLFALDWAANKARVWSRPHSTPAYLLRKVFATARDYSEAKARLIETPIASPCIYTLAGLSPDETVVIEREEETAEVHEGPGVAANHWQSDRYKGSSRGVDSEGRARLVGSLAPDFESDFDWLKPPVLNPLTRLVMVADAREARVQAQGYENEAPATALLDVVC